MSKPLFTYFLFCDTCGVRLLPREGRDGDPQSRVVIEEVRKDHANKHARGDV